MKCQKTRCSPVLWTRNEVSFFSHAMVATQWAQRDWGPRGLKLFWKSWPNICQNRSPVCRTANEVPEPKAASFTARLVATGGALMRNVGRSIIAHFFKTTRRNINALYSWGLRVTAEDSEKGVTAEDSEKQEEKSSYPGRRPPGRTAFCYRVFFSKATRKTSTD